MIGATLQAIFPALLTFSSYEVSELSARSVFSTLWQNVL